MADFARRLFSTDGFMPRWECGLWSESHGWLHIVSDLFVFGAYSAIPLGLWYFIAIKKHQVPFSMLYWLFGLFIMSCGLTHLIDASLFWKPWYRLSGAMKLITAIASWATVVAMVRVMPRALALPGMGELNRQLSIEIQQRREAEAEREKLLVLERAARSEAEHANRMKEEFVATLSHELRTPLNAILGYVTLLREEEQRTPSLDEKLEVIERNTLAQKRLIEDLLDLNRIVAGKMRLDVQPVDLGVVIESALDSLRPFAMSKGIRLLKVTDGAITVRGDPMRLQQILANLLSNAVKFTPSGGKVEITMERVNSHVELTVTDTGIGIKPEQLSIIFERFQQAETSSTRRYGGLGLGLAISKSLVELHGGSIVAKSPGPGEGSSFRVSLPLPVMHEDEPALGLRRHPSATPSDPLEQTLPKLEGIRILVIDDDTDSRELLKAALAKSGAEVQTVDCAPSALEKTDAQFFDVLVSDIGMPEMSGIDLIKELRNREHSPNRHTPAIALTAFAATEDRKRALLAGFDSFLSKPVDLGEVVAVVSRMASRRR